MNTPPLATDAQIDELLNSLLNAQAIAPDERGPRRDVIRGWLRALSCIYRVGCPKPDVCAEVGHCTSQTRAGLEAEKALTSKERVYLEALRRIIAGPKATGIDTPEDQVRWMWSVANNAIACANGLPDETSPPHRCLQVEQIEAIEAKLSVPEKYPTIGHALEVLLETSGTPDHHERVHAICQLIREHTWAGIDESKTVCEQCPARIQSPYGPGTQGCYLLALEVSNIAVHGNPRGAAETPAEPRP